MADSKSGSFPDFAELCAQARQLEKNQLKVPPTKISGALRAEEALSIYPKEMEDYTYSYLLSEATKVERKVFAQKYSANLSAPQEKNKAVISPGDMSRELHQFAGIQQPPATPDLPLPPGVSVHGKVPSLPLPAIPKLTPPIPVLGKSENQGGAPKGEKKPIELPPLPTILGKKPAAQMAVPPKIGSAAPPPIPDAASMSPAPPPSEVPPPKPPPENREDEDYVPLEVQEFEEEGDGLPNLEDLPPPPEEDEFKVPSPKEKEEAEEEGVDEKGGETPSPKKRQLPPVHAKQEPLSPSSSSSNLSPRLRAIIEEKMRRDDLRDEEEKAESLEVPSTAAEGQAEGKKEEGPIVFSARERLLMKLQAAKQSLPKEAREISEDLPVKKPDADEKEFELSVHELEKESSGPGTANESGSEEKGGSELESKAGLHEGREEEKGEPGLEAKDDSAPFEAPVFAPSQRSAGGLLIKPIFSGESPGNPGEQPPGGKAAPGDDERMRRIQRIMEELSPDKYKASAIKKQPPAEMPRPLAKADAAKAAPAATPPDGPPAKELKKKKPAPKKEAPAVLPEQPATGSDDSGQPPSSPAQAVQKPRGKKGKIAAGTLAANPMPDSSKQSSKASKKKAATPAQPAPKQQPAAAAPKKGAPKKASAIQLPDTAAPATLAAPGILAKPAFPQLAKQAEPQPTKAEATIGSQEKPPGSSALPVQSAPGILAKPAFPQLAKQAEPQPTNAAPKQTAPYPSAAQALQAAAKQKLPAKAPPAKPPAQKLPPRLAPKALPKQPPTAEPEDASQVEEQAQKPELPGEPEEQEPVTPDEHEQELPGEPEEQEREMNEEPAPKIAPGRKFPAKAIPQQPPAEEPRAPPEDEAEGGNDGKIEPEEKPQAKFPSTLMQQPSYQRMEQSQVSGRVLPQYQQPGAAQPIVRPGGRILPGGVSQPGATPSSGRTYVPPMRARQPVAQPEEAPIEHSKLPVIPLRRLMAKPQVPAAAEEEPLPEQQGEERVPPQIKIAKQIEKAIPKKAVLEEEAPEEKTPDEIAEEKRRADNAAKLSAKLSQVQIPSAKPRTPPKTHDIAGEAKLPEEEEDEMLVAPPPPEVQVVEEESIPTPQPEQYEAAKEEFKGKMAIEEKKEEIKEYAKAETDEMLEAYAKENMTWLYEIYKMGGMSREDFLQKVRDKLAEEKGSSKPADSSASAANPAFGSVNKELEKRSK